MRTITVISLFESVIQTVFSKSIFGRAAQAGIIQFRSINLRDFASNKHKTVDNPPVGGGQGMVIRPDVVEAAVTAIPGYESAIRIYPCPMGKPFSQARASDLASQPADIIFLVGYYEGVDDRAIDALGFERWSIGDWVVSSGELPALLMTEAIVRLIPGVIGNAESAPNDSIISGLLEHPIYTTPPSWAGRNVPPVLRSGNHGEIATWKLRSSLRRTLFLRPDLLAKYAVSEIQSQLLVDILQEDEPCHTH